MERDLLKARLARLPQLPPIDSPENGEEVKEEEAESADAVPSLSRIPPQSRRAGKGKDYSPSSAAGYLGEALEVDVPYESPTSPTRTITTFRVYYTPPNPSSTTVPTSSYTAPSPEPSSLLSGGPARAPWATDSPPSEPTSGKGVVFVAVHGAGYSGLSFACMAKELVEQSGGKVGVLVYDARGHGKTRTTASEAQLDMSLEAMSSDLVGILSSVFPNRKDAPALVLVGHSMGGAVAVDACPLIQQKVADVTGLAVLDVVEGTALEALAGMSSLIAAYPKGFDSVSQAIEWHIRTKTLNNLQSARISVPPLIIPSFQKESSGFPFVWRADLGATAPCWEGWFTGLSKKFLDCKTAKLLILAGADRLDKPLMIGQMQGKYQLEVYPDVGHCLQEDAPGRTAETLLSFWSRNDRTDVLAGVKKVGQK